MEVAGQVALVSGANRGIGRAFTEELLRRGALKVYAGARKPDSVTVDGVEPIALDITNPGLVNAAAAAAGDVTLLVNNAGIGNAQNLIGGDVALIREELDTNLFGTLSMIRAFAPVLARNGGGGIINVLSAASWITFPGSGSYAVSKAASWSMTTGVRMELADQGTQVTGTHVGLVDTDLTAGLDLPKISAAEFAQITLDGFEQGLDEVIADEVTRQIKAALAHPPGAFTL